jgi:hypothetical protein
MGMMKVWITKYALTAGLFQIEAEQSKIESGCFGVKDPQFLTTYYHKKDWQPTRHQAVSVAEDMRKRRIASLKKQIKKFEALKWEQA